MHDFLDFDVPALSQLMSEEMLQDLLQSARPIHYAPNQVIHLRGDQKPGLSIIKNGAVALGTTGLDGEERIMTTLGPGQSFGEFTLFGNLPRTHDAVAIGETTIDQVSKDAFTAFTRRHPNVIMSILVATTKRLHAALEFAEDLRRLPSHIHVAKTLASLAKNQTGPTDIQINQTQIGQALGLSRVSVNQALSQLEAAALIRRGYGKITVLDPTALRGWVWDHSVVEPL